MENNSLYVCVVSKIWWWEMILYNKIMGFFLYWIKLVLIMYKKCKFLKNCYKLFVFCFEIKNV